MALIECNNCKKKVSDTRDNCPFCNYPLKEIPIKIEQEESSNLINYNDLIIEEKNVLQKQFLNENENAHLYFRKKSSSKGFGKLFLFTLVYLILYVVITLVICVDELLEIYNERYLWISLFLVAGIFVFSLLCLIITKIVEFLTKVSSTRIYIIKLYQDWLLKKGYSYEPSFNTAKEETIFKQISIN